MEIVLHNKPLAITPNELEDRNPTFSLLHGRRFEVKTSDGKVFVSLNILISAVKNAAAKSEKSDSRDHEIQEFSEVFNKLKDRGYERNGQINKVNFLTRIITKIKHSFAKIHRDSLLKELDQVKKPISGLTGKSANKLQDFIENDDLEGAKNFLTHVMNPSKLLNGKQKSDGSYDHYPVFLLRAIEKNSPEMVKLLLEFKASPNTRGRVDTPITLAAKNNNLEILKLLMENGGKVEEYSNVFRYVRSLSNVLEMIECLVKNGPKLTSSDVDPSPLAIVAARWDENPEKVQKLLLLLISKGAAFGDEDAQIYKEKIPKDCLDFLNSKGFELKEKK